MRTRSKLSRTNALVDSCMRARSAMKGSTRGNDFTGNAATSRGTCKAPSGSYATSGSAVHVSCNPLTRPAGCSAPSPDATSLASRLHSHFARCVAPEFKAPLGGRSMLHSGRPGSSARAARASPHRPACVHRLPAAARAEPMVTNHKRCECSPLSIAACANFKAAKTTGSSAVCAVGTKAIDPIAALRKPGSKPGLSCCCCSAQPPVNRPPASPTNAAATLVSAVGKGTVMRLHSTT